MSRFFQSLDEEKQETRRKTTEIVEKAQEKLSKREQKMKDLETKIEELKGSGKNFEKLFKKFMNEIKKYTSSFENNELPTFVADFFDDQRIKASKPMSASVSEFLSLFEVQQPKVVEKKTAKKKETSVEETLEIENDDEREKALWTYLEQSTDVNSQCEALLGLFSIYGKKDNVEGMIDALSRMDLSSDSVYTKRICAKIDVYLGRIFKLLTDVEDLDILEKYRKMLSQLKSSGYPLDMQAVNARILELEFIKMGSEIDNDHPVFRLLYLTRKKQWLEALEHFTGNSEALKTSEDNKMLYSTVLTLSEFARLAVTIGNFELALETYVKCTGSGIMSFQLEIYALCVALCDRLEKNPHFLDFLEFFKHFDANYLCLPSCDLFIEICRAFYYLNALDPVLASGIIESATGFQLHGRLEEISTRLYNEKYAF